MATGDPPTVPRLLERLRAGDETALSPLVTALYPELHRIASRRLRGERSSHTLQTTDLLHEAYLKLAGGAPQQFADRVHFLAVASRVMRQVLVDYARSRAALKRSPEPVESSPRIAATPNAPPEPIDIVALDSALDALDREDASLAKVIEMRYFGGMTADETAEALGQSVHVVRHDLRLAQAWLRRKLDR